MRRSKFLISSLFFLKMKNITYTLLLLTIFISQHTIQAQTKEDVYILFEEDTLNYDAFGGVYNGQFKITAYHFRLWGEDTMSTLDTDRMASFGVLEDSIPKIKPLSYLDSIHVKDIAWLRKQCRKQYSCGGSQGFFDNKYNPFIVEIDSLKKQVKIIHSAVIEVEYCD